MKTSFDTLLRALHAIGAALLALLTLVICYDVAGRLLFNRPFAGTAELTGAGLVLLSFLQAPSAMRRGKLLRVTFLLERLPARAAGALVGAAWLIGALVFATFLASGWEPAIEGWRAAEFYGNDAFRLPAWPLRFGTLFLWFVGLLVCLRMCVDAWRGRAQSDPAPAD